MGVLSNKIQREPGDHTYHSANHGLLKKGEWLLMIQLLLFCCVIYVTDASVPYGLLEAPSVSPISSPLAAPTRVNLPLAVNVRHFMLRGAARALSHADPPLYGPLITAGNPPTTSQSSNPSMESSAVAPPLSGFKSIAPQSNAGTMPPGLTKPPISPSSSNCCKQDMVLKRESHGCHCVYPIKLDIILLNVSTSSNWKLFLDEFAHQLGLQVSQIELNNFYVLNNARLNISMDITPHSGVSFSASDASAINSSLVMHKVKLDPSLAGDYKLLNMTWFKPPPPSQAPVATSPLDTPPNPSPTLTSLSASNKGKHSNWIRIIGIGAGILFVAIISVLIICLCAFRQEKIKASPGETEKQRTVDTVPAVGSLPHPSSTRFLAYEELKQATNNFEPASILGEGGFGKVFKGVLSDGTAVAIKRLTNGGQQGDKEFLVEVEMLSRLHHRNLVKLVGYYSSRDSAQNLLCYELVPNGSLEAWLHGPLGVNCPLDWDTRMKIALDAARGLAYLHEDSQPCVIHRDFKASNILLENDFHAKVADFGLAKQAPEGRINYLSTRVMGTFGYVAPEYAMTGHLLVKSDVYSYGVVLLELLTGRRPVDMSQPSGQENLVTWARPILRDKDRLEELADPSLGAKYPKEDFVRVCTIAAACVAPEASQRPTMGEVVQSLKMVQRITEYQDSALTASAARPNYKQSSTTFESDVSSSMFSSGR
ncbi:hypothetical protein M0R45_006124 [Rubus argutus]|uniref:Protein kinase domain-containing protein n=1 Tax=Rubus argutus TaxID=59490 RepID=A0AAW1YQ28_RUBAR